MLCPSGTQNNPEWHFSQNTHWKHKMKCIQIKKRSENDQYNETSNHRQMKGYGGSGGSPRPRGSQALPLPPPPFICIWFEVSLYWSFSPRFLFVYISFYASNIELISFSMLQKMYVRIFCSETVNLIVFSMWIFLTVSTLSFAGGGALFLTAFKQYLLEEPTLYSLWRSPSSPCPSIPSSSRA